MLNVSQSLLHPDQYRFGIKSPVLLYSHTQQSHTTISHNKLSQKRNKLTTYNYDFIINERYYVLQLETALCYQHYFCNTELRTAIITEIKGLSIQTQQNTFVLFTII